jgi:hypothetical protein
VTCYWWRQLTRGIIIFHNGTCIDEFEGIRGKMSVLRKSLSESGEFGIEWWKGNLEAVWDQEVIRKYGRRMGMCGEG